MSKKYFKYTAACFICLFASITSAIAQDAKEEYKLFGDDFNKTDILSGEDVIGFYEDISTSDSLGVAIKAKVNSVCKMKGCWMKLDMGNNEEVMVKFKDYAFFVPKDIEGKEVIISGKAFVNTVSVDELKHYAKDAGKSEKEIAAISKPKKTYSFEASGVKIKQ